METASASGALPRAQGAARRVGWGRWIARATRGSAQTRLFLILATPTSWLTLFLVVPLFFITFYGFAYTDDSYVLQVWPPDGST